MSITEPPELIAWRKSYSAPMPKCCHTCYHLTDAGSCRAYLMVPPDEFKVVFDQCEKWEEACPF